MKKNKPIYLADENILTPELKASGEFVFVKSGLKDPEIIQLMKMIENPIILFTKNAKDFNGKLKAGDRIVKVNGLLDRKMLNEFLPKAKGMISRHTSLHKYHSFSMDCSTGIPRLIARSGTNDIKEMKIE